MKAQGISKRYVIYTIILCFKSSQNLGLNQFFATISEGISSVAYNPKNMNSVEAQIMHHIMSVSGLFAFVGNDSKVRTVFSETHIPSIFTATVTVVIVDEGESFAMLNIHSSQTIRLNANMHNIGWVKARFPTCFNQVNVIGSRKGSFFVLFYNLLVYKYATQAQLTGSRIEPALLVYVIANPLIKSHRRLYFLLSVVTSMLQLPRRLLRKIFFYYHLIVMVVRDR